MRARSVPRWLAVVLSAAALALVATFRPGLSAAEGLEYTHLDDATVRVFAFAGVAAMRAEGKSGQGYVLAVPIALHGSGLVVSQDGLILTARHAVEGARIVAIRFPGGSRTLAAQVVYSDKEHDHAFLVVEGDHLSFVEIPAQGPKMTVREQVYVIGYPLDASRDHPQSQQGIVSGVLPDGSLQLGIALNPGNSGGPVVDTKEHLLGIAVARADPRAGAQGIGVAVPVEQIVPGYQKMLKGKQLKTARQELASRRDRLQAEADLLGTLLTSEDMDTAYRALRGKKGAAASSHALDESLKAAFKVSGGASADTLSLAAAQMWNAAAVALERRQSGARLLSLARQYAEQAIKLDPEITKRSPFIVFVQEGHEPTDVAANLPRSPAFGKEGEEEEEGQTAGGEKDAMDVLLNSLKTDKSLPLLRIGPTLGITTPFQLIGVGVSAKLMLARFLNLDARYQIGFHAGEDIKLSHLFEALAGVAVGTWNGSNTEQLVVDIERRPLAIVYNYVPGQVPSVHTLIVEAGVISGQVNLRHDLLLEPLAPGGKIPTQIYVFEGGLRYVYFIHATSPYLARSVRTTVELSAHLLAPPLGVPARMTDADGKAIRVLPGFKADVAWGLAPLDWGLTEVGLGYFPAGGWIYFRLGWTYLFY